MNNFGFWLPFTPETQLISMCCLLTWNNIPTWMLDECAFMLATIPGFADIRIRYMLPARMQKLHKGQYIFQCFTSRLDHARQRLH